VADSELDRLLARYKLSPNQRAELDKIWAHIQVRYPNPDDPESTKATDQQRRALTGAAETITGTDPLTAVEKWREAQARQAETRENLTGVIHALKQSGLSERKIAERLGIDRITVRADLGKPRPYRG